MDRWSGQIEKWRNLRDQADGIIKSMLEKRVSGSNASTNVEMSPKSRKKNDITLGRALWTYTRSDLTIKTIQMKLEEEKRQRRNKSDLSTKHQ